VKKYNNLKELPIEICNAIDFDITPDEAIALHLEWGQLRSQKYYNTSSDSTFHFCINTWGKKLELNLVKRKGFDSWVIGIFDVPSIYIDKFWVKYKGVFSITDELKNWIKDELK